MKNSENEIPKEIQELTIKGELWQQLPFAPDYYVSNIGRVYGTLYHRLLQAETSHGYKRVFIKQGEKYRHYLVHILVATAFCEKSEGKVEVHHRDTNKNNNRACNLQWVTKEEHAAIHRELRRQAKERKRENHENTGHTQILHSI